MEKKYPWLGEKTEKIQIRVTPEEKRLIKAAADSRAMTVGQYLLSLYRKDAAND